MSGPGAVGNPNWRPGVSGNPFGRPRTKIDGEKVQRRVRESLTTLAEFVVDSESPYSTSVQLLQAFAESKDVPLALRISAAAAAAPYEQPKLQPVPGPVYLYSQIDVPEFTDIETAESFLLLLSQREASGALESASVATVTERVRLWIHSKRQGQEIALKQAQADATPGAQVIHIIGGLPELPGTTISMPALSGHDATGLPGLRSDDPGLTNSPPPEPLPQVPVKS